MFTESRGGDHYATSAANVITAVRYFKANPGGRIATGMWTQPSWGGRQFWEWFDGCLAVKINRRDTRQGRRLSTDYQLAQRLDARMVNEYHGQRRRQCGTGLLRTPELRRRFPEVNCQRWEE